MAGRMEGKEQVLRGEQILLFSAALVQLSHLGSGAHRLYEDKSIYSVLS